MMVTISNESPHACALKYLLVLSILLYIQIVVGEISNLPKEQHLPSYLSYISQSHMGICNWVMDS